LSRVILIPLDERPALPRAVSSFLPRDAADRSPGLGRGFPLLVPTFCRKLVNVIGQPNQTAATRRLSDLRRAQPADATLKNLLGVLSTKLELCASLPVFEWEAGTEGYEDCAAAFRNLAEAERRSCTEVLDCLRMHMEHRAAAPPLHGRESA
jgi:hypothetical protein